MALPNSNISVAMVKSELGAATNDVGQLCIHPNINKWSRWKPVKLDNLTSGRNHPTLGTIIPSTINQIILSKKDEFWEYEKPTGGASSPYRLGDFREYEHTAKYSDAPFGIDDITTAGSNTVIPFLYGGGTGSNYINTPKNMPLFQSMYAGIQIFGADQVTTIMDGDHLHSYCASGTISSAISNAFFVPTTLFSTKKIILIIPFISTNPFTDSSSGAGGSLKYIINGFNQKTYKYFFPNGEPALLYVPANWQFNRISSYQIDIELDLIGQWTSPVYLYGTYLDVEFWSELNATGIKVSESVGQDYDSPRRFPHEYVPEIGGSLHVGPIPIIWGGPFKSIKVTMRDYYRNKTYDSRIYNVN